MIEDLSADNVFYKRRVEELDQKLKEQNEVILSQKQQVCHGGVCAELLGLGTEGFSLHHLEDDRRGPFPPVIVPKATLDIEMPQTVCLKVGKMSAHDHLEKYPDLMY